MYVCSMHGMAGHTCPAWYRAHPAICLWCLDSVVGWLIPLNAISVYVHRHTKVLCGFVYKWEALLNSQLNQPSCEHSPPMWTQLCVSSWCAPNVNGIRFTYALLLHINARKLGYRRCSMFTAPSSTAPPVSCVIAVLGLSVGYIQAMFLQI